MKADMEIKEFIRHVNGRTGRSRFHCNSTNHKTKATSMAELKADLTDLEKKKVGDRVTICHELLTNMLVTSEGVQMPTKADQYLQFQNLWGLLQQ
jgi:hypothetical protein